MEYHSKLKLAEYHDKLTPSEKVIEYALRSIVRIRPLIESDEFNNTINLLCKTKMVWTTGMGKCSYVSRKFAATLACNNIAAAFIHPGEAAHGDFGAIKPQEVLVAFSNSGKTEEVLQLARKTKANKVRLICISGDGKSPIAKLAEISLIYGKITEACSLGLTPTTSIVTMQVIADALAMEIQRKKHVTFRDFKRNHHGGYIGKTLNKM
jgi:arabinose-5-phosphate isomerase